MNSLHAPNFEEVAARAQFSAVDLDRQRIRDLLESWVVWRDAAEWDRLATVWVEEIPLASMDRPLSRVRAKVAGPARVAPSR